MKTSLQSSHVFPVYISFDLTGDTFPAFDKKTPLANNVERIKFVKCIIKKTTIQNPHME